MPTALQILEQGTYANVGGELREWSHDDTFKITAGIREYILFTTQKGTPGNPQGLTNNPGAGMVPNSTHWAFDALQLIYSPNKQVKSQQEYLDMRDWFFRTRLYMEIENKSPMHELRLCEIFKQTLPIVVTGAAAGDNITERSPGDGIRPLFVPLVLAAQTPYSVRILSDINPPASMVDDEIAVIYKGAKRSAN